MFRRPSNSRTALLAARALVALALGGCGSTAQPLPDAGGGLTVSAACAALAGARCARLDACTAGTGVLRRFGDTVACNDRERAGCVNGLGAPQSTATPTAIGACAAAITAQPCADFENGVLASACVPAAGPRSLGQACATGAQCQSTYCAINRGSACGACATPQAPGASCASIGCSRGLTCASATQTCQNPGPSGGSCDHEHPCGFGLSCVGAVADGGTAGTCQTGGAQVAVACDPRRQAKPECDRALGLYCEPSTLLCARLRDAAGGESCGLATGGMEGACTAGGVCVGASGRVAGRCVQPAAPGGACDLDVGPPCLAPTRCIVSDGGASGTCQQVNPATCG